jgi:hydroxymethylpyrimidine pyrophosphatase-like HAD family hydrolase
VAKSTGLKVALAQYDLDPAGLVAIGDGRNDIEMLTYAGLGIAMESAPDEVKAAADEVTKSVEDDGVAAVLNRWF